MFGDPKSSAQQSRLLWRSKRKRTFMLEIMPEMPWEVMEESLMEFSLWPEKTAVFLCLEELNQLKDISFSLKIFSWTTIKENWVLGLFLQRNKLEKNCATTQAHLEYHSCHFKKHIQTQEKVQKTTRVIKLVEQLLYEKL